MVLTYWVSIRCTCSAATRPTTLLRVILPSGVLRTARAVREGMIGGLWWYEGRLCRRHRFGRGTEDWRSVHRPVELGCGPQGRVVDRVGYPALRLLGCRARLWLRREPLWLWSVERRMLFRRGEETVARQREGADDQHA